jgi:hypothetical protein
MDGRSVVPKTSLTVNTELGIFDIQHYLVFGEILQSKLIRSATHKMKHKN